jgi:hypothetical protein
MVGATNFGLLWPRGAHDDRGRLADDNQCSADGGRDIGEGDMLLLEASPNVDG